MENVPDHTVQEEANVGVQCIKIMIIISNTWSHDKLRLMTTCDDRFELLLFVFPLESFHRARIFDIFVYTYH